VTLVAAVKRPLLILTGPDDSSGTGTTCAGSSLSGDGTVQRKTSLDLKDRRLGLVRILEASVLSYSACMEFLSVKACAGRAVSKCGKRRVRRKVDELELRQ
jgi:hypothetical protein